MNNSQHGKIKEPRIGSIAVDLADNSNIRISSISDEGYVLASNNTNLPSKLLNKDIGPLYLQNDLLGQITDHGVLMRNPKKMDLFFPNPVFKREEKLLYVPESSKSNGYL